MASPITFGVEIEFNLAFLYDDEAAPDRTETRAVDIPLTDEVIRHTRSFYGLDANEPIPQRIVEDFNFYAKKRSMLYNVRDTLTSIGCTAEIYSAVDPPSVWEVLYDESLKGPEGTSYRWLPMEITSPALPLAPESLDLIKKVCTLIEATYITNTNWSTSVHVHISEGKTPLDFHTMQKLYAFLWAFEPQMSTLHPPHRQQSSYCRGMREQSAMVSEFTEKWGEPPSILKGIVEFYKCQDLESLLSKAFCYVKGKFTAFNPGNALCWVTEPHRFHKPTIECRQHEGTLEGERITQWVKLLAGLVQSLEIISPESFTDLLKLVQNEKWEKTDKDKAANDKNQAEFGPIPAESTLTIIDILIATPNQTDESREAEEEEEEGNKELFQSLMLAGAVTEDQEEGVGMDFDPSDSL
ncbi:hypothetical protein DL98DRAFT_579781 [Cadophora sp. DSE1049]|nr:hypothetical protein DL98DRAFT_579781 [Cadophora sp. DSE1049]